MVLSFALIGLISFCNSIFIQMKFKRKTFFSKFYGAPLESVRHLKRIFFAISKCLKGDYFCGVDKKRGAWFFVGV